jgi:4-diphosphocytidyl-2-C-methyl-D-erythritol kinase
MIQFPNAKINLGLSVLRKLEDGYHDLDSIFYPIALNDALEFIPSNEMKFELSGIAIPGAQNENLIIKAYNLLKNDYPAIKPLHIYLLKNIPTGGGLGGGSSDAAFMLNMMNTYFDLALSKDQLLHYALQLGSDCPFFIYNTPCHASGRGDRLDPVELDLTNYHFILVLPGIHIPTAKAFQDLVPSLPNYSTKDIIAQTPSTWKDVLKNDFELSVFKQYPILKQIKDSLYEIGATYASMSGSGSTLYGLIEKDRLQEVKKALSTNSILLPMQIHIV